MSRRGRSGGLVEFTIMQSARSVDGLVHHVKTSDINLAPPYQRRSVWTTAQRQNLIRSFVQGIPVPAIVWNDRILAGVYAGLEYREEFSDYAVIDGKQRIETLVMWMDGKLEVPASWFDVDDVQEGCRNLELIKYTDLEPRGQRHFQHKPIAVCEARLPSVEAEAEVYLLLNQSGTSQTEEDLERARRVAQGLPA